MDSASNKTSNSISILWYDGNMMDKSHFSCLSFWRFSRFLAKNSENFGAGISRNIGISQSVGEIIAFIDSDDYWFKEKLEKQLNFMNDNNLDFTFCNYQKKISEKKSITIISSKKKFNYN